jgi:ABC-type Fe3+-hydroxamate transport system substrate-binding protein
LGLKPDLVIANQEENSRDDVEILRKNGIPVWVTFPKTIRQALDDLWALTEIYHRQVAVDRLRSLETALDYARMAASETRPVRYFCPIWEEEIEGVRGWMTFNAETYPNDLLSLFGGDNVFKEFSRDISSEPSTGLEIVRLSTERDTRYPKVTLDEIFEANPEIVLLPNEPYPYTYQHTVEYRKLFMQKPTGGSNIVVRWLDGSLVTWHGTRLAKALQELNGLFSI